MIKIKFQNEDMIEIKRAKDNIFKCKYEKNFKLLNSLYKYIKKYNNKSIKSYKKKIKIELIDINDSDISELMNMNNRIILIDYFDTLISHEKC